MAPMIALAVCSLSVLEVCSHVAGPPFTASSLLADQDRWAGWRKREEHTSPPIPVLTSPDSFFALVRALFSRFPGHSGISQHTFYGFLFFLYESESISGP